MKREQHFQVPGITAVGAIDATLLQNSIPYRAICGMEITITTGIEWLDTIGIPEMNISTRIDSGRKVSTHRLVFKTATSMEFAQGTAFVVRLADGRALLIGSKEKPWPVVESETKTGTPAGDTATTLHTVSWEAPGGRVECLVYG